MDTLPGSDDHGAGRLQAGEPDARHTHYGQSSSGCVEAAKSFYTEYLGLSTKEFNMGWVARFTSAETGANVQLVTRDAVAPVDPVISVHADDVDDAYEEAQELGYEIVHPLTTEPWGVRRFFVRAPDGNVINILQHRD